MPVPGQFFARASGRHRIACKALYRALLKPCLRIPLPTDLPLLGPENPIKHLIRKRFRQNIKVDSPFLIRKGLKAGYLAVHLLCLASQGVITAIEQIHTTLHAIAKEVENARRVCTNLEQKPRQHPRVWPYPGAPKVVDIRPLPIEKISSGRRHVPSLVMTSGGLPFLRFKRPQSPFLSRILRDKVTQRQRWLDHESMLEKTEEIGKLENTWEVVVLDQIDKSVRGGIERGGENEWWTQGWGRDLGLENQGWDLSALEAREEIKRYMLKDRANAKILGEKMIKIHLEEKRLSEFELEMEMVKREEKRPKKGKGQSDFRHVRSQVFDT